MSNIKRALSQLKNAVSRLESSAHTLEYSMTGKQRDMFGTPVSNKKAGNGAPPLDNSVIAQRLDKAIKKVEELLEG